MTRKIENFILCFVGASEGLSPLLPPPRECQDLFWLLWWLAWQQSQRRNRQQRRTLGVKQIFRISTALFSLGRMGVSKSLFVACLQMMDQLWWTHKQLSSPMGATPLVLSTPSMEYLTLLIKKNKAWT